MKMFGQQQPKRIYINIDALNDSMVKLNKLNTRNRGLNSFLSPLEMNILSCLWKTDNLKVRQIHKMLGAKRSAPVSSIAVTLDRLHKNKIVRRKIASGRGGMHYIYSSRLSKSDFEQEIVEKTVNGLLTSFGQVAFAYFNERFSSDAEKNSGEKTSSLPDSPEKAGVKK
jgi:predicted transcriptional regulator